MEERFGGWRERKKERKKEREGKTRKNPEEKLQTLLSSETARSKICVYVRLYDDSASTRIRKSEKGFEIKKNKRKRKKEKMIKPKK